MKYAVVIEQGKTSYGAYVPDLPGCVAVGESEDEVRRLIAEAIAFHLDGLREEDTAIPEPHMCTESPALTEYKAAVRCLSKQPAVCGIRL